MVLPNILLSNLYWNNFKQQLKKLSEIRLLHSIINAPYSTFYIVILVVKDTSMNDIEIISNKYDIE